MVLLDLQDMAIPEAQSGALMASWDSNSNSDGGGESNISLLLCG